MKNIALLVLTDGREEYLKKTVSSALTMLKGNITELWMHDDTGDDIYRQRLLEQFPTFTHIGEGPRRGYGGVYNHSWAILNERSEAQFVFSLEDDFTFNREVPLDDMAQALEDNSHVYQMALRRQAWNDEERLAGGVIERWPDEFHQQDGWISHKRFFTSNPNLYRRSLIERVYPDVKDSEGHFSISVLDSDPNALFGYWGLKTDAPWVHHIGVHRNGGTY